MLPKHVRRKVAKGRTYYYFDTGKRVDGKTVLAKLPDIRSQEFGGSYAALLGHRNRAPKEGMMTVPKLVDLFERSKAWRELSAASQKLYSIYLRRLEKLLPTAPVALLEAPDMQRLYDNMGETPGAANGLISTASALFGWAKPRGYLGANPCDGVKREKGGEHMPWPEHLVTAALASDDDAVRLLAHLLYYTGQRLSDVLAMAWRDIQGEHVTVRQRKTGKVLMIRLHSALRAELATRVRDGVVICTSDGKAIKDQGARYRLQKFAGDHGCQVVPHGLRKNAVMALLEAGNSVAETAAISGQSYRMVEYYARQIDQKRLGDTAILRWERNEGRQTK